MLLELLRRRACNQAIAPCWSNDIAHRRRALRDLEEPDARANDVSTIHHARFVRGGLHVLHLGPGGIRFAAYSLRQLRLEHCFRELLSKLARCLARIGGGSLRAY